MRTPFSILLACAMICWATSVEAFCGMYVSKDASAKMYNDATQVFLMRHGTYTVVTMRNRYDGPMKDFAMLVPVPQVLTKLHVKTLKHEVLDRIQSLTAPRLVAYQEGWCGRRWGVDGPVDIDAPLKRRLSARRRRSTTPPTVAAQFKVGEYDIVILSAKESTGLATWLGQNGFKLPKKAKPILDAYIQQGMYFFVAKVDPNRVRRVGGVSTLSPLRFHYVSKDLALPIRLGMLQARGAQDLLVHVLANMRQEVANRPNVFIPTNLEVVSSVQGGFAAFYEWIFASTLRKNPGAAVTEYAWTLGAAPTPPRATPQVKCDPCPPAPKLPTYEGFSALGADLLSPIPRKHFLQNAVLTRLHLRLTPTQTKTDLVFRAAEDVSGGVGMPWGDQGETRKDARTSYDGARFQARYMILRHTSDVYGRGIWGSCRNTSFFPSVSSR